ncbi:sensor histidine kinase [Olsenella profusa]|uniref:histidine kinase n=1 Tax=Olsenella profusa F0195 TaxID=1125712 RepID=U2SZB4_9ACTN|nr:HAMP domain-containing sensor histidine kinase [Olsenella profusa]ERL06159.1 GHKL domain protein [Olsenella profusa F0195]
MSSARDRRPLQGGAGTGDGGRRPSLAPSIARSISWGFWWRRLVGCLSFDLVALGLYLAHALAGGLAPTGVGEFVATSWAELWPWVVPLLVVQLLWPLHALSDTRRVRRQLKPLNDLALRMDALVGGALPGQGADQGVGDRGKMASLEQAIERASVDSPHVSTGDRDLASIEVALNRLLRQMQDAKLQQMRFVNDASHELRTPLAVIRGYVDMLDRWGKDDPTVLEESIAALKSEGAHMQELVEQLLFLARGDAGRNELHRSRMDLAALVREVCEESQMIDDAHQYRFVPGAVDPGQLAGGHLEVEADEALVKQALRIIVQNAAKYSPEGTTISLSASAEGPHACASVQDEGTGMSEETVRHAFERFYRGEEARQHAEGTGLGLSIAKWIVDRHGGTLSVVSSAGVGSRLTIALPPSAACRSHEHAM